MPKTVNRQTFTVSTDSSDYNKVNFSVQANFKGIIEAKNDITVDQNSFESANNIYTDTNGILVSRPPIKFFGTSDTGENEAYIIYQWSHDIYSFRLYKLLYKKTDTGWQRIDSIKNSNDLYYFYLLRCITEKGTEGEQSICLRVKITTDTFDTLQECDPVVYFVSVEDKIYIWFGGIRIFVYDTIKKCFTNVEDHLYLPITEIIVNGLAKDNESLNVLTSGYRKRYQYSLVSDIDWSNFVDKDITAYLNDRKIGVLSDLDKTQGENLIYPYIQAENYYYDIVKVSNTIEILRYRKDTNSLSISFGGKVFDALPTCPSTIIGNPVLMRDGTHVVAFTIDGVARYKFVATETNDFSVGFGSWIIDRYSRRAASYVDVSVDSAYPPVGRFDTEESFVYFFADASLANQYFYAEGNGTYCCSVVPGTTDPKEFLFDYNYSSIEPVFGSTKIVDILYLSKYARVFNFRISPVISNYYSIPENAYFSIGTDSTIFVKGYYKALSEKFLPVSGSSLEKTRFACLSIPYNVSSSPDYQSGKTYEAGTFVVYSNQIYRCNKHTTSVPGTDVTWSLILPSKYYHYVKSGDTTGIDIGWGVAAFLRLTSLTGCTVSTGSIYPSSGTENDFVSPGVISFSVTTLNDLYSGLGTYLGTSLSVDYGTDFFDGIPRTNYTTIEEYDSMIETDYSKTENTYYWTHPIMSSLVIDTAYYEDDQALKDFKGFNFNGYIVFDYPNGILMGTLIDRTSGIDKTIFVANDFKNATKQSSMLNRDTRKLLITGSTTLPEGESTSQVELVSGDTGILFSQNFDYNTSIVTYVENMIWLNSNGSLYTNLLTNDIVWNLDETVEGIINTDIPTADAKITSVCLSYNDKVEISSIRRDTDFSILFYLPKSNEQSTGAQITALHLLGDNILGVFTKNSISYLSIITSDDGTELYSMLKNSILSVGCRENDDVYTAFDGQSIIFPTARGLAVLAPQDFIATTDKSITYLSEPISNLYELLYNNRVVRSSALSDRKLFEEGYVSSIRIKLYKYYFVIYKEMSREILIYDMRSASWWKFETQYPIRSIDTRDRLHLLLQIDYQKKISDSRVSLQGVDFIFTDEEIDNVVQSAPILVNTLPADIGYYDDIIDKALSGDVDHLYVEEMNAYRDVYKFGDKTISWSIQSQKLHFGAINNYKSIRGMNVNFHGNQAGECLLTCKLFRDYNHPDYSDLLNIKVNTLGTFVHRMHYMHVINFQYRFANKDNNDQFRLNSLSLKFEVKERVR